MTEAAFGILFLLAAVIALRIPFVGLCVYIWLDLFSSYAMFAGAVPLLPFSQILGIATIVGTLLNFSERSFSLLKPTVLFLALYGIWITLTTSFAVVDDFAWGKWERTAKTILMVVLMIRLVNTREKFEAAVISMASAISIDSVQGAAAILNGFGGNIDGAGSSLLSNSLDRNFLALRFVACIPLLLIVANSSLIPQWKWKKTAIWGIGLCLFLAVVASFSRGAVLGLAAMVIIWISTTRKKTVALITFIPAAIIAIALLPDTWLSRITNMVDGLGTKDGSVTGRFHAWQFAWDYAVAHPILGGGFYIARLNIDPVMLIPLETHSFFFELIAEQGFIGTGIYMCLLGVAFLNCAKTYFQSRTKTPLPWQATAGLTIGISLIGTYTAGLFINTANQVLPFYLIGLSACQLNLRETEPQRIGKLKTVASF